MSNIKPRVLVYDSSRFFFKYFKNIFLEYDFKFYWDYLGNNPKNLKQFELIIFIMERPIEFIDFLKIYNKNVPVLFCPLEKSFYAKKDEIQEVCGATTLDMSGTKMDISEQLKEYLKNSMNLKT